MAHVALHGKPVAIVGSLPAVGAQAPGFTLVDKNLEEVSLGDYLGRRIVLNIFPSVDTPTCAMSVRRFNAEIGKTDHAVAVCVSLDLPFAHARFCGAEGIGHVASASAFRDPGFGDRYGVRLMEGPLKGLFARAVVVIDEAGRIAYTQLVPDIAEEPDYEAALEALENATAVSGAG